MKFLLLDDREALYGGAAGGGKLLPVETPVATPSGFVPIGALRLNDALLGKDGKTYKVLWASQPEHATAYKLTFDDGETVIAHDNHLWLTYTSADLAALTRLNPIWRAKRRATRPARSTGTKSALFVATLRARNAAKLYVLKEAPTGNVRTTAEIVATLTTNLGRTNHAIPVTAPFDLPECDLPIDPYILGAWLGDGTSANGAITTADPEMVASFAAAGYEPHKRSGKYDYGTFGLHTKLSALGLLNNKHVPSIYLWASAAQRLALLQGLLDTDGTVSNGQVEFCSTKLKLASAVAQLACSLGHKAVIREGRATLYGKDCGPKWTVKFTANTQVFRLSRKASKLKIAERRTTAFRYIVAAERVESRMMRCITVSAPDGLYLIGRSFIPTHNSEAALIGALQYVDCPNYAALILRRTYKQLSQPDALMDRARTWMAGTKARWDEETHTYKFPSGATVTFGYLDKARDHEQYQGAAFQYVAFDEITQFLRVQYVYLLSRLRRLEGSTIPVRARVTGNPGGIGHYWVYERFVDKETNEGRPFVPARLEDNPHLDRGEYEHFLAQLDPVTYQQLRFGDWTAVATGGLFLAEWFDGQVVDKAPEGTRWIRYWDLAATEASLVNPDPDYTVGLKLGMTPDRRFFIGDVVRDRTSPAGVDQLIYDTAQADGRDVPIYIEQEPGSSGKAVAYHYTKELAGYTVTPDKVTGDKSHRARPLAAQMRIKNVWLVKGAWNRALKDEFISFPVGHDDQVDAGAGALDKLAFTGRGALYGAVPQLITGTSRWRT